MRIELDNYSFYCSYKADDLKSGKHPIVFLHGFSGSSENWEYVEKSIDDLFAPVTIDLFGHGQSDSPSENMYYTSEGIIKQIERTLLFLNTKQATLCGYSMGGRAVLSFALQYPKTVKALVLESSTAGLDNNLQRIERLKQDAKLANLIKLNGIEWFTDYWLNLPMFSSQKKLSSKLQNKIRSGKLNNCVSGLVNSLKGFGAGSMQSYWERLSELRMPVKLIVGEYDNKYIAINNKLHNKLPYSELSIIEDCGHNTHLEKPAEFVSLVNNFVGNLLRRDFVN